LFGPTLTTAEGAAQHLLRNSEDGETITLEDSVIPACIEHGDAILDSLASISLNFTSIGSRNGWWVAKVIGRIRSDKSKELQSDLRTRRNAQSRLIGLLALLHANNLMVDENDLKFLAKILLYENEYPPQVVQEQQPQTIVEQEDDSPQLPNSEINQNDDELKIEIFEEGTELKPLGQKIITKRESDSHKEMAAFILGKSRSPTAFRILLKGLEKRTHSNYFVYSRICDGIANYNDPLAIEAISRSMTFREFRALPSAFRALISMGAKQKAIELAVDRVSPTLKGHPSAELVDLLEKETGQNFWWWMRFDKDSWKQWWESNKSLDV